MNESRCVCCGELVPEGWMVCIKCEMRENEAVVYGRIKEDKKINK